MWPTLSETFLYLQIDEMSLTPEELQIYDQERTVVIASIEDYTERKFERTTSETMTLKVFEYRRTLKLDQYPVNAINSIELNGEPYGDEWYLDGSRGLLYVEPNTTYTYYSNANKRYFNLGTYTIDYDYGYDDLPTLLLSVYYDLFLYRYQYRQQQGQSLDLTQVKRASVAGVATIEFNTSAQNFNTQWVEYLNSHQDTLNKYVSERGLSFDR